MRRTRIAPSVGVDARTAALTVGAIGVVFGDIGTSPLYAVNEIFFGHFGVASTRENIFGCISLILWSLTLVIAIKYVIVVLRADNDGEGGIFALYGLLRQRTRRWLALTMVLAAGLLFGDGVITPAISVLSAVEGLRSVSPELSPYVLPVTIGLLSGLFAVQRRGTSEVGRIFGPVLMCWFITIGALGLHHVTQVPAILRAIDPTCAIAFIVRTAPYDTLLVLGGVMLTVTGGEALYLDIGHFGTRPIRLAWFLLVFPALVLNYLGQGAYLLSGAPVTAGNVFFSMVGRGWLPAAIALAAAAAVLASQALISGAFSLASQATALGLFPRMKFIHTHHMHAGQVYAPFVNWALYVGSLMMVVGFGSSDRLAAAYGLGESGVMFSTSLAMTAVARYRWKWVPLRVLIVVGAFLAIDAIFLAASSLKFWHGGYVPLAIGLTLFVVMLTWDWGRRATSAAYSAMKTMSMGELVALKETSDALLPRNVVLMVPKPLKSPLDRTPALLQLYLQRCGLVPLNLIFVEVAHRRVPHVHGERYHITVFQRAPGRGSIISVTVRFGFMETPNVGAVLEELAAHHEINLSTDPHQWIVHGSQENIVAARSLGVAAMLRFRLFSLLRSISTPGHYYYGLGDTVQLSLEILPVKIH